MNFHMKVWHTISMKVYVTTSRPIGEVCKKWAKRNMPKGFEYTDEMNHCDIFVSVLYDKILPIEYLKNLKGAYNFHPGVLPEYRGAATFSWAIINGEETTGVTLHEIDEGIDTGPILAIRYFPVGKTAEETFKRFEDEVFKMFKNLWPHLLKGAISSQEQDEKRGRTYYRKDLEKVKDLTRFVRALTFKGKESAYYYNSKGEKIYLNYYASS